MCRRPFGNDLRAEFDGDLAEACEVYFGSPRQQGTSHSIYKTLWAGDPRLNGCVLHDFMAAGPNDEVCDVAYPM